MFYIIDIRPIQRILSFTRKAIEDYGMISQNDRIAIGVSGGKDSLALLCAMTTLSCFYPKKFEVVPITIGMGYTDENFDNITEICDVLGLNLHCFPTEIHRIVFEVRKEKNPCSLCANLRRGALNNAAINLSCNKVALAHHFDDTVETFYMNLFNEGRIDCYSPVTYLSRTNLTVIRPFIYVPEKEIKHFIRVSGVKPSQKYCPADQNTDRQRVKHILAELEKKDRGVKARLFKAIEKSGVGGFKVHPKRKSNTRKEEL